MMKNEFFDRDTGVVRIESTGKSIKLDDEFFNRNTEVARVHEDDLPVSGTESELHGSILDNAKGPKRVQGDSGSVEQHSLQDQIAAERFLQSKKAAQSKNFPLKIFKIAPGGTT